MCDNLIHIVLCRWHINLCLYPHTHEEIKINNTHCQSFLWHLMQTNWFWNQNVSASLTLWMKGKWWSHSLQSITPRPVMIRTVLGTLTTALLTLLKFIAFLSSVYPPAQYVYFWPSWQNSVQCCIFRDLSTCFPSLTRLTLCCSTHCSSVF
jgi:hypothetical protein